MKQGEKVHFFHFWGHTKKADSIDKSCFSQWYPAPFTIDEIEYKTAEHYMMAEKARLFNDDEVLQRIISAEQPKQAKDLGRKVRHFNHKTWEGHAFDIVVRANLAKFSQCHDLKGFLLSSGKQVLVEASPFDKIWGIGMKQSDPNVNYPKKWLGDNLLGFALMQVRDQLKSTAG